MKKLTTVNMLNGSDQYKFKQHSSGLLVDLAMSDISPNVNRFTSIKLYIQVGRFCGIGGIKSNNEDKSNYIHFIRLIDLNIILKKI